MNQYKNLIGKKIQEVEERLKKENKILRVVRVDGNSTMCTCDYKSNRINVEIENDVIVDITSIG